MHTYKIRNVFKYLWNYNWKLEYIETVLSIILCNRIFDWNWISECSFVFDGLLPSCCRKINSFFRFKCSFSWIHSTNQCNFLLINFFPLRDLFYFHSYYYYLLFDWKQINYFPQRTSVQFKEWEIDEKIAR